MTGSASALGAIPAGLRDPLLAEYQNIVQNFLERRWTPSELSGGKFCEIVYTVLTGFASGAYPSNPSKPSDFVSACRKLEAHTHVPRSFQILIPRLLPALYEIRNNRGVGHVGGDVDPNHMDAVAVLSMCNWVMAELVRVFHSVAVDEAQRVVDGLAERRVPLVWQGAGVRRVLDPDLPLKEQILLLLASVPSQQVGTPDLQAWTGYSKKAYFLRLLRQLHGSRLIELSADDSTALLLPPGARVVEEFAASRARGR